MGSGFLPASVQSSLARQVYCAGYTANTYIAGSYCAGYSVTAGTLAVSLSLGLGLVLLIVGSSRKTAEGVPTG